MTKRVIKRNAIRCKKCGDTIESKTVHDFVTCKCGAVSCDGGHEYLRRCGRQEDIEELSVIEEIEYDACGECTYYVQDEDLAFIGIGACDLKNCNVYDYDEACENFRKIEDN